jgi:hypothetical protein
MEDAPAPAISLRASHSRGVLPPAVAGSWLQNGGGAVREPAALVNNVMKALFSF